MFGRPEEAMAITNSTRDHRHMWCKTRGKHRSTAMYKDGIIERSWFMSSRNYRPQCATKDCRIHKTTQYCRDHPMVRIMALLVANPSSPVVNHSSLLLVICTRPAKTTIQRRFSKVSVGRCWTMEGRRKKDSRGSVKWRRFFPVFSCKSLFFSTKRTGSSWTPKTSEDLPCKAFSPV